jgi:hypothetical protein
VSVTWEAGGGGEGKGGGCQQCIQPLPEEESSQERAGRGRAAQASGGSWLSQTSALPHPLASAALPRARPLLGGAAEG